MAAESIRASDTTGRSATSAGQSHSWLRPTSCSRRPSAQTISVAEGSSETMRTSSTVARALQAADTTGGELGARAGLLDDPLEPRPERARLPLAEDRKSDG